MKLNPNSEFIEKLLCLIGLGFAIELVFFKFLPDISTGLIQSQVSQLTDFDVFRKAYIDIGTLSYTRPLGSRVFWAVAQFISHFVHSQDIRLHPLRITAGILTPLYVFAGALPVLRGAVDYNWRRFMAVWALVVLMGLYLFYPYDMPALALASISLFFLLRERLGLALMFMLFTGLVRETSFHIVTWVGLWMLLSRSRPIQARLMWFLAFVVAFVVEYQTVRHFYPGPMAAGGILTDWRDIFLSKSTLSLTVICSLGLQIVLALACLNRLRNRQLVDWRGAFFVANCCVLPAWWIFYRVMASNLAEFRLLMPALLPLVYGLAEAADRSVAREVGPQSGI